MFGLLLAVIYLSFISLGLPDSLLGAVWPSVYQELGVPISSAGVISVIISIGTVVSSLQSDRLTKRLGTGKVTMLSVGMTALALFGYASSHSFLALCLWAIPYGLGAGSVDASLNNYVALHYKSRHMSWLHCMWGVGASVGPYIMAYALTGGLGWNAGYRIIGFIQLGLTAVLLISLPLWKTKETPVKTDGAADAAKREKALSLGEIFSIPGAKAMMLAFFCYCALEQTTGLWASSYLAFSRGVAPETAAGYASLFYLGVTAGRLLSGFLAIKFQDTTMVRIGQVTAALGVILLFLPLGQFMALAALLLIGLGCAPIYPSMLHATPMRFGADKSQAIIGVQMASAYVGTCVMPPLFGLLTKAFGTGLLPFYLCAILILMVWMHESMLKRASAA